MTEGTSQRRLLGAGAGASFVVSLILARFLDRTLIMPDESGHILNALQLRSGLGPNGLGYYHGYSVLLAPFVDQAMSLESLTLRVQIINSLLTAVTFVLLFVLGHRLRPDVSAPRLLAGAAIVTAYPAYRLFAALALSENLLVPGVVAVLLLLLRASREPSVAATMAAAAAAGLIASVHPRTIVVPVAALITVWICRQAHRALFTTTMAAVTVAVIVVQASLLAAPGIAEVDSASRDTLSGILRANTSLQAIATLPFTALGQLFYLSASTLGLFALGAATVAPALWQRVRRSGEASTEPMALASAFVGILFAGSVVVSALFLNQTSGDQAIYGRYLEGIAAPLLLIGCLEFLKPRTWPVEQVMRIALLSTSFATLALLLARGADTFDGRQQLLNITGVFPVIRWSGHIRLSELLLATAIATGFVFIARRRSIMLGAASLVAVFAVVSVSNGLTARSAVDNLATDDASLSPDIARAADALGVDCVALDQFELTDRWHQENYRLLDRSIRFEYWDSNSSAPPCSSLAVSSNHALGTTSELLSVQPLALTSLWALEGADLDRLSDAGFHPVSDPGSAIDSDQQLLIEIEIDGLTEVKPGEQITGTFVLTNLSDTALVPTGAFSDNNGIVNVGIGWRPPLLANERVGEPTRFSINEIVQPGATVSVDFKLRSSDALGPLDPGTYFLTAEVVQEGVRWTETIDQVEFLVRWKNQGE